MFNAYWSKYHVTQNYKITGLSWRGVVEDWSNVVGNRDQTRHRLELSRRRNDIDFHVHDTTCSRLRIREIIEHVALTLRYPDTPTRYISALLCFPQQYGNTQPLGFVLHSTALSRFIQFGKVQHRTKPKYSPPTQWISLYVLRTNVTNKNTNCYRLN